MHNTTHPTLIEVHPFVVLFPRRLKMVEKRNKPINYPKAYRRRHKKQSDGIRWEPRLQSTP